MQWGLAGEEACGYKVEMRYIILLRVDIRHGNDRSYGSKKAAERLGLLDVWDDWESAKKRREDDEDSIRGIEVGDWAKPVLKAVSQLSRWCKIEEMTHKARTKKTILWKTLYHRVYRISNGRKRAKCQVGTRWLVLLRVGTQRNDDRDQGKRKTAETHGC